MSPLPTLYIAPLPGGAWLVDTSEALVTAQAGGAPVTRVDVEALVRVTRAAAAYRAAHAQPYDEYYEGIFGARASAEGELDAALAALGDSALLGKGE